MRAILEEHRMVTLAAISFLAGILVSFAVVEILRCS